jgi:hypothetical protein
MVEERQPGGVEAGQSLEVENCRGNVIDSAVLLARTMACGVEQLFTPPPLCKFFESCSPLECVSSNSRPDRGFATAVSLLNGP